VQEAKEEIQKLGYQIVAVTPDKVSSLSKTIQKTKLDYILLSDSKADAIQKFGLAYTVEGEMKKKFDKYKINLTDWSGENHNMLPVPAIYIINKGEVLFNYVNPNYSKRLETNTLLSLLKTI
jgi:peroxiredoxin